MKLFAKYNQVNIATSLAILLLTSIAYYFLIRTILLRQIDKDLKVEQLEILDFARKNVALPDASSFKGQKVRFQKYGNGTIQSIQTTISNGIEDGIPVRVLTFPVPAKGIWYKAFVVKSKVEAEYLLEVIVWVTASVFMLVLAINYLLNRFFLGKLWKPFYDTLYQLQRFDVKKSGDLRLLPTNITEFIQLNQSLLEMTRKINHEFDSLRSFTDNASHEMQTPLAIIDAKLDLLIQHCNQEQGTLMQGIYTATRRLSNINRSLLLLTRINNQQFNQQQEVNLEAKMLQKFNQFDELIRSMELNLNVSLKPVTIRINEELLDILLNNLISNAIKHNHTRGFIHCTLDENTLLLENSGLPLSFNTNFIFRRFQKGEHSTGTGLGLAISHEICMNNGFAIAYNGSGSFHQFMITFQQND